MNQFIEKSLISNKCRTVDLILSILSNSTIPTTKILTCRMWRGEH